MFRQWLRGNAWVRPDDVDYMPAEVNTDGWEARLETGIRQMIRRSQDLLDALEPFVDPDSEAAAAARACLEAANAEIEGFARAVAERRSSRPVRSQRIRAA